MAIYYLDYLNGLDATTATPLGWWSVVYTNGNGTTPPAAQTATGGTSGSTAITTVDAVVTSGTWAGGNAAGTLYFYGKSAAFSAETLTFTNGATCSIASDFTYCAWRTFTNGATAARIAPGDTIRIAKSDDPVSVGSAEWFDYTTTPGTLNIASSTNATPIVVTVTSHGYSNGDLINVQAHTTNTNANNTWEIANVTANTFELVGSVGNGVGGATGTVRKINTLALKLATAQNKIIDFCESAWTASGASTCTASTTSRQGYNSSSMQKTSPSTNTLYAYKALSGATDYSAYQKITFWIRNSTAITAGQWTLTLCSDAAGVTAVDTFAIPAIPSTNTWVAMTLARNSGGNLGASIQSVGLKTGATAPSSITILLDNLCAATTSGLNLNSLISKNSSAQGGTEDFIPIQSINTDGKWIVFDSMTSSSIVSTKGYSGSAGSVTTYIRNPVLTGYAAATGTNVNVTMDSGTLGNMITFAGGYDTSTNTQIGETFFCGSNSLGNGILIGGQSYIRLEHLSLVRYSVGLAVGAGIGISLKLGDLTGNSLQGMSTGATAFYLESLRSSSHNNQGLNIASMNATFDSIGKVSSNGGVGIIFSTAFNNKFTSVTETNCNSSGVDFSSAAWGNFVKVTTSKSNTARGISNGSGCVNNTVVGVTTTGNAVSSIGNFGGVLNLYDSTFNEGTVVATPTSYQDSRTNFYRYNNTDDDHRITTDNATVVTDATTRHTASDFSWATSPTALRNVNYKMKLKIAEIPCNAGAAVTFKAWVKLGHATNIASSIVCPGGQDAGVPSDVVATKTADTNWEELTITFTPTEQKVMEIYHYSWYVAGNSTAWVDDITVTQA